MAYTFTTFDPVGQSTFTVSEEAVDGKLVSSVWTGQIPITLLGRGATDYGQDFGQSLINMLSNFASQNAAALNLRRPLNGQLWYNKSDKSLRVNTGTQGSPIWTVVGPPSALGFAGIVAALGYTPVDTAGDTMTGALTLNSNLTVNGPTDLLGNVSTNSVLVNTTLQVTGAATLIGAVSFANPVTMSGTLQIAGQTSLSGQLILANALNETAGTLNTTGGSNQTLDIGTVSGNYIFIGGTGGTIASFGSSGQTGIERVLRWGASATMISSASIILPGPRNLILAPGDVTTLRYEGAGIWRLSAYVSSAGVAQGPATALTTVTGTDASQFLTAAGFAGNKTFSANGFYKLPGGLIMQWGSATVSGSSQSTITFPMVFTSGTSYSVTATYASTPNSTDIPTKNVGLGTKAPATFSLANGDTVSHTINWLAIGS